MSFLKENSQDKGYSRKSKHSLLDLLF